MNTKSLAVVVLVLTVTSVLALSYLYLQTLDLKQTIREKELNCENLLMQYGQLNLTYNELLAELRMKSFQCNELLASVKNLSETLETSRSDIMKISEEKEQIMNDLERISDSYDALLVEYQDLRSCIERLSQEYEGLGGVFLLNYRWTWGVVGMDTRHTGVIELFNVLEECNVTVKVYGDGGASNTFVLNIPAHSKKIFVENWSSGIWAADYSKIIILDVTRK